MKFDLEKTARIKWISQFASCKTHFHNEVIRNYVYVQLLYQQRDSLISQKNYVFLSSHDFFSSPLDFIISVVIVKCFYKQFQYSKFIEKYLKKNHYRIFIQENVKFLLMNLFCINIVIEHRIKSTCWCKVARLVVYYLSSTGTVNYLFKNTFCASISLLNICYA